jgi:hypothetical protein
MWAIALFFLTRLFLGWSRDKNWSQYSRFVAATAVAAMFLHFATTSIWLTAQPTYLYLAPTHNLIDAERRAFFIQQVGPHHLTNIDIALRDNKSGTVQTEKYSEIELGRQIRLRRATFGLRPRPRGMKIIPPRSHHRGKRQ